MYKAKHSPAATVRLCFALLLLHKEQDGIHMPRRLMDDLEGEISDKKLHKCALWHDILSADLDGEDSLLLNICEYCAFSVPHNVSHLDKRISRITAHAAVRNPTPKRHTVPLVLFLRISLKKLVFFNISLRFRGVF